MTKSLREVVECTIAFFESDPATWGQHAIATDRTYYDTGNERVSRVECCLVGALVKCEGDLSNEDIIEMDTDTAIEGYVTPTTLVALMQDDKRIVQTSEAWGPTSGQRLVAFNDAEERTFDEVLAFLRDALAKTEVPA